MKIALPMTDGKLCLHFGHCEKFKVFMVDGNDNKIKSDMEIDPPPHEPGLLPKWLSEQGVNCVIAGGMGSRAQNLFSEYKIKVVTGASADDPRKLVEDYLSKKLVTGANVCDH